MPVRTVILAEDNEALRRLYADLLAATGFNVMRAADGEKAVALVHKVVNPHLIILDVMMPRMTGVEACIRIRRMQGPKPCPILFLTALDDPQTILDCLRAGGDDYLMKSSPLGEILDRIRYWSRRGHIDNGPERRARAIRALEALAAGADGAAAAASPIKTTVEQLAIDQLAAFVAGVAGTLGVNTTTLYRFGYLVGLAEACAPSAGQTPERFADFMRELVAQTGIVDESEAEALLDTYAESVNERLFKDGWERGRSESADVGMPRVGRLNDRFDDPQSVH